jgi:UDP-N-acetylmuramate: L-alanyl-gamma-D-glutamyl-meso-diaminopimelate ligase
VHLHILGICGTLMGGLARLAHEAGHAVSGSDQNVYPPMSTQLTQLGVTLNEGYRAEHLQPAPDCVVIGNALSRGNPAVEYVLNQGLPYTSGPEWLAQHILRGRWVLAVAGTHGKTTTSSMLAWILEHAGLEPGFLIGGVAQNFGVSARLGSGPFFIIEADEYDSAFFDKRPKFIHYRPRTAILNNLEFDHADIFPDLAAIEQQFHYFIRTIPGSGLVIGNGTDEALARVLKRGCWTPVERFGVSDGWGIHDHSAEGFDILYQGRIQGRLRWEVLGAHNQMNALAAIAAARHAGVTPAQAIGALQEFQGVQRRMEVYGVANGVTVYDDFAHHPTAIAATLHGLRQRVGTARILAVLEPRSNTMRLGAHRHTLAPSLSLADAVFLYQPPDLGWELSAVAAALTNKKARVLDSIASLSEAITLETRPGDHVLIMSNGGFGGLHERVLERLKSL